MAFNSLYKIKNSITDVRIKTGDILQINYDGKDTLVLVVDPNAPKSKDKLHCIKLKRNDLKDSDIIELMQKIITLGDPPTPSQIRNKFEKSKYNLEENSYRTYKFNSINAMEKITFGQQASGTNKITFANGSVLYGVTHGKCVELLPKDYKMFKKELENVNGNTFYEGSSGHEDVTEDLISFLYSGQVKAQSWEPELSDADYDRLYKVTELFGSDSEQLWEKINSIILERNIFLNDKTLVDIISETSGPSPTYSWSRAKHSTSDVESLVALSGVESSILNTNFTSITESDFIEFHGEAQRRAFAQYEGEDYEEFIGSKIQRKATLISRVRQRHLYKLMRKIPGIYFAGDSHVDDMRDFINE